MKDKDITLTISNENLVFTPTPALYSEYLGAIARGDMSDASNNFVMQCAVEESKETLRTLDEQNAGAMIQIASSIVAEFAPKLKITVKK